MTFLPLLQLTFFSLNNNAPMLFDGSIIEAFFKFLFVTLSFLYLLFALVVTRQIKVMRTTLITSFSPLVRVIGYAHLIAALLVFIFLILFL